jgi:hypothetical protein
MYVQKPSFYLEPKGSKSPWDVGKPLTVEFLAVSVTSATHRSQISSVRRVVAT